MTPNCKIGFLSIDINFKELGKNSYYINANKIYKNLIKYKHYYEKINDTDINSVIKHKITSSFMPSNYTIKLNNLLHIKEELNNAIIEIQYEKNSDCVITEENPFKIYCIKKNVTNNIYFENFDLSSIYILNSNEPILKVTLRADIVGTQIPMISSRNKIFNLMYNHQVMNIHTMKNFINDVAREQQLSVKSTLEWIREELQGYNSYNMNTGVLNDLCNFLEKNINI